MKGWTFNTVQCLCQACDTKRMEKVLFENCILVMSSFAMKGTEILTLRVL